MQLPRIWIQRRNQSSNIIGARWLTSWPFRYRRQNVTVWLSVRVWRFQPARYLLKRQIKWACWRYTHEADLFIPGEWLCLIQIRLAGKLNANFFYFRPVESVSFFPFRHQSRPCRHEHCPVENPRAITLGKKDVACHSLMRFKHLRLVPPRIPCVASKPARLHLPLFNQFTRFFKPVAAKVGLAGQERSPKILKQFCHIFLAEFTGHEAVSQETAGC